MIPHYIRISLRNLRKYKTQTAISISAMAVSLTLLAIVASLALSIKQIPLLRQPYSDRAFQLLMEDLNNCVPDDETMSLISGHQFKSTEAIHHIEEGYGFPMNLFVNPGADNEMEFSGDVFPADKGFLKFLGMKSIYSGKEIIEISDDEIVLTEKQAKILFGKEKPIGKKIRVHSDFYGNIIPDKIYTIKDVIENPTPNDELFRMPMGLFVSSDQFVPNGMYNCYFVLRKGMSPKNLEAELAELLGTKSLQLFSMKEQYSNREVLALRNGIIIFLILFALISFSNYLKQQLQLFRFREREVALRTCVGGSPKSLLFLFSIEVLTVLAITLILTLILIYLISNYLLAHYQMLFESRNYSLHYAVPLAFASIGVLILISFIAIASTIIKIRRNQTGLALRMKPQPKHHLRNIGLTFQMAVSIVFTCITIVLILSGKSIKDHYGIPDEETKYRKSIIMKVFGVSHDKAPIVNDRIQSLKSDADFYKILEGRRPFLFNEEKTDFTGIHIVWQNGHDAEEFFGLKSETINEKANPDKHVLISKTFRDKLIEKNMWNGKSISIPNEGDYEIKGIYDYLPFEEKGFRDGLVVFDKDNPNEKIYYNVIVPKDGMTAKVHHEVENIIDQEVPNRIDTLIKSYYDAMSADFELILAIITVVYILAAISTVTTMAAVYAGISLDTRRRRKEMALRKLNGADRKIIAMIFLRTYIWIVGIAAVIALPVCFIAHEEIKSLMMKSIEIASIWFPYFIGLIIIIAVTLSTIAWKIRDIMHADPIDYLKE